MKDLIRLIAAAVLAVGLSHAAMAQSASDLQTIRDRGVLKVGAAVAAPYYTKDLQTGEWQGVSVDIAKLIAAQLKTKIEFVETQWGTAAADIQAGRFDIMLGYTATPERALVVDFTDPIGGIPFGVVTPATNTEKFAKWDGLNDPKVKLVAADGTGSTTQMRPVLTKTAWTLMPSYSAVYLELDSGRHDAGLMDAINGKGFITARAGKNWTFVLPTPALATDTNIALKKSNPTELLRWLNLTVNYLKQRGELKTAWDKYTN